MRKACYVAESVNTKRAYSFLNRYEGYLHDAISELKAFAREVKGTDLEKEAKDSLKELNSLFSSGTFGSVQSLAYGLEGVDYVDESAVRSRRCGRRV